MLYLIDHLFVLVVFVLCGYMCYIVTFVFFLFFLFFFFKQKTAYEMRISDWSSDVCSSDLFLPPRLGEVVGKQGVDRGQPRLGQRPFGIEQVELAEFAFAIADAGDAGGLRRRREGRARGGRRGRSEEHV